MKKIVLKQIIAITVIFSILVLSLPANAIYMTSVPKWARDSINFCVDNGYMTPASQNSSGTQNFEANSFLTKADFVTILYKHAGSPSVTVTSRFSDVSTSAAYAKAVTWACNNSIAWSASSTTFEPNSYLLRENAIRMLYNYADYCECDITYPSSASLSNFTDANQVSSAALPAIKWAVYRGIINGSTIGTASLTPKNNTTRAQAAQMIRNFGMTVEGIKFNRDTYNFTNSSDNFYSTEYGEYFIIDADSEHLRQTAVAADVLPSTWDAFVSEKISREWRGSCYGMVLTTVFDKMGRLDVNSNRVNVDTLHDIGLPKNNYPIESMINYYQLLQCMVGFEVPLDNSNLASVASEIKNSVINNGMCIVAMHYSGSEAGVEHAVIAYNVNQESSSSYSIDVYDPNFTTATGKIHVNTASSGTTAFYSYNNRGKSIDILGYLSWNDLSIYDDFDLDGPNNNWDLMTLAGNVGLLSTNPIVDSQKSSLYIDTNSDFTVTNSSGEQLIYDFETNTFSGDMELYRKAIVTYGEESSTISYILTVAKDDSFTMTTSGGDLDCHILSDTSYIGVTGTNIDSMVISPSGSIKLYGETMDYTATLSADEVAGISFSGEASGDFAAEKVQEKVNVSSNANDVIATDISTGISAAKLCNFNSKSALHDNVNEIISNEVIK